MTPEDVDALVDALVPEVKALVEATRAPLQASLDSLVTLVAELEQRIDRQQNGGSK